MPLILFLFFLRIYTNLFTSKGLKLTRRGGKKNRRERERENKERKRGRGRKEGEGVKT